MGIVNLEIVFSPSLQISIPVLHAIYNNRKSLFPNLRLQRCAASKLVNICTTLLVSPLSLSLCRYTRPNQHDTTSSFVIPDPDNFNTEE